MDQNKEKSAWDIPWMEELAQRWTEEDCKAEDIAFLERLNTLLNEDDT